MLTRHRLGFVACLWIVSSCVPRPAERPPPVAPGAIEVPSGAESLAIDPERSVVLVLVRRAGPLARLGHNHAIVSSQETGVAWIGADLSSSGFEVRVPVEGFVVDDPGARAGAGPDFEGVVPEDARRGTRSNMLRAEVLDAGRHPDVVVSASRIDGTWEHPAAAARVTLRGVTREFEVPLELRRDPQGLVATGAFAIRQTDFGMTPFSVAGGAVQVADEVEVRFEIVAAR